MRIVEPHQFHPKDQTKSLKKKLSKLIVGVSLLILVFVISWTFLESGRKDINISENSSIIDEQTSPSEKVNSEYADKPIIFSGNEFRLLYDNIVLPNTIKIDTPSPITGNDIADARIRQLAEMRGYKLRRISSADLLLKDGYQLHEIVHSQWRKLQKMAYDAGLSMTVVSAYRSVEEQKTLFNTRLRAEGISVSDIAGGVADEQIKKVLVTTAVPGYSKHHSGYTIDLLCAGWDFENFINSNCYKWLSAENYSQARQFGFIPSYPKDADLQGPDPEAWEYVFVGVDLVN
jgi:LAS superfamily LD-carboxypeptidase LdcB